MFAGKTRDYHGINTARLAEVWMDEYKKILYWFRPDMPVSYNHHLVIARKGNITNTLNCQDDFTHEFNWHKTKYNQLERKFHTVANAILLGNIIWYMP